MLFVAVVRTVGRHGYLECTAGQVPVADGPPCVGDCSPRVAQRFSSSVQGSWSAEGRFAPATTVSCASSER
jgi:hypothetical protein